MPNLLDANLRHAILYLQQLDAANDRYQVGGNEASLALLDFDHNRPNICSAQKWLAEYASGIEDEQIQSDKTAHVILDLCNAYPDAGAYLINLRLSASERIQWLKPALNASQRLGNAITTQAHSGNLGLAHNEMGDFHSASKHFESALQLAEQIGDKHHQGAWLGDLGNIFSTTGDHEKAIEYHERHLHLAREINDTRGEGHALANLGVSHAYLGNVTKAIENYKQFLDLAIQRGDRREESQALMNLGFAYFDLGNFEEADRSLHAALQIAIELGDKLTQCLVMGGMADINIDCKEYQIAIRTLQRAFELLKETPDIRAELRLLQSLGNAHTGSDDYQRALETYTRLYVLAESVGSKAGMCSALANQISIHRFLGNFSLALKLAEDGVKISEEINSLSDKAFILWQMGLIYEAQGAKEKALNEFESAIRIEAQISMHDLASHRQYLEQLKLASKGGL